MRQKLVVTLFFIALFIAACGPSKEEIEKQKRIEDSIANVERESALDKASQLLNNADSAANDSLGKDSVVETQNK